MSANIKTLAEAGALRQLRHNDGSEGFVLAYDKDVTDRYVAELRAALAATKEEMDEWRFTNRVDELERALVAANTALAAADRKNLELTRVNAEQRLQEQRLEVALARAKAATAPIVAQPVVSDDDAYGWFDLDSMSCIRWRDGLTRGDILPLQGKPLYTHSKQTAPAVPPSWQWVPKEPTPEMISAAFAGKIEDQDVNRQMRRRAAMADDYRAMLAAAPAVPADGEA